MKRIIEIGSFAVVALFLAAVFLPVAAPVVGGSGSDSGREERGIDASDAETAKPALRHHVLTYGEAETGAVNLVTAIYLGYRAFDTFGETVVLLLAVSGVLFLVKGRR